MTEPHEYQKGLDVLRRPFPPEEISRLPKNTCKACSAAPNKRCDKHTWISRCQMCGGSHSSAVIHLDYVGHADLTNRLLDADPLWTWEPVAWDENGEPHFDRLGGMWIKLTVLGVTRLGYGDPQGKSGPNAIKEVIGDALRNAAMRFGAALDLWAKGDRNWDRAEAGVRESRVEALAEKIDADDDFLRARLTELAKVAGMEPEDFTAKWRMSRGQTHAEALALASAQDWAEFLIAAEDHLRSDQVSRALLSGGESDG
jgi:hypothetical protein